MNRRLAALSISALFCPVFVVEVHIFGAPWTDAVLLTLLLLASLALVFLFIPTDDPSGEQ